MCNLDVNYTLIDATDFADRSFRMLLEEVMKKGFRGVKITHPFKTEVAAMVGKPGAVPTLLGSFNTLVFEDRQEIFGTNTDYSGFRAAYKECFGMLSPGKTLVLGCGGGGDQGL